MTVNNRQLDTWTGDFGREYLQRNEDISEADMGPRTEALRPVLAACAEAPRSILEVGANIGRNLLAMTRLSDAELYAVEPFADAYARMTRLLGTRLAQGVNGPGQTLPFADASIDFVFTSGVLIHVAPEDLPAVTAEIVRVSRRYVWCNEYFAKTSERVHYRGGDDLLFKRDFGAWYLDTYPQLRPVAQGFCWSRTTPFDDTTWWLFEKVG